MVVGEAGSLGPLNPTVQGLGFYPKGPKDPIIRYLGLG